MRAILAPGVALIVCGMGGAAFADAAWCPDLARVADLAATNKLAYIAGAPREGSFRDAAIALPGWRNCSLYGSRTYTCDSRGFAVADQAARALRDLVTEVRDCLGEGWIEDEGRSSPVYVVVRNARDAASMTLSTDEADDGEHVVRLTLFVRGR